MIAVQLEVLEAEGLESGMRAAVTVYGQPVYTAPGLTMESPVRVARLPKDVEIALAVLPAEGKEPSLTSPPLPLEALTAEAARQEVEGRTAAVRWTGWLPLSSVEEGATEQEPRIRATLLLEAPEGADKPLQAAPEELAAVPECSSEDEKDREVAFGAPEAPRVSFSGISFGDEPMRGPALSFSTEVPYGEVQSPRVSFGDEGGRVAVISFGQEDEVFSPKAEHDQAEGAVPHGLRTTPSFAVSFCSDASQDVYSSVQSSSAAQEQQSPLQSPIQPEPSDNLPRFGSFRLHEDELEEVLSPAGGQRMPLEVPRPSMGDPLLPPPPPAKPTAAGGIVWPWFDEVSTGPGPLIDAPELDFAPTPPLLTPRMMVNRHDRPPSPERGYDFRNGGPARDRADSRPPSPPRGGDSSSSGAAAEDRPFYMKTAMVPRDRGETETSIVSEAELMHSVVGRLYTQLVQAAHGAVMEKWTSTFDAIIAELRRGGAFCREAEFMAAQDRSTEIDLSAEFPPERRQAQKDQSWQRPSSVDQARVVEGVPIYSM